jgi:hypothetical protein
MMLLAQRTFRTGVQSLWVDTILGSETAGQFFVSIENRSYSAIHWVPEERVPLWRAVLAANPCFHCDGIGRCDCLSCSELTRDGYVSGPCVPCKNRAANEARVAYCEAYNVDPREAKYWRMKRRITGGSDRVFDVKM